MNISNYVHQILLEEEKVIVSKKRKISFVIWLTERFSRMDRNKYHIYLSCQTEISEDKVYSLNPLD